MRITKKTYFNDVERGRVFSIIRWFKIYQNILSCSSVSCILAISNNQRNIQI